MKKILKIMLLILSYMPISSVAVAAYGKASEIEGENQKWILRETARQIRYLLLPTGQRQIDLESARQRYSELTGLNGEVLDESFAKAIQFMMENGYIQMDEKTIITAGASHIIQS